MSNDKPIATAVVKFYANKHVKVELDSIKGITPRTLSIAGHILQKTYAGMKGKHVANEHRLARERKARADKKIQKDETKFHEEEDERLLAAALEDMPSGSTDAETGEGTDNNSGSVLNKIKDAITG